MRKIEFIVVLLFIIASNSLFFFFAVLLLGVSSSYVWVTSLILTIMDAVLSIFYIKYMNGILPSYFYTKESNKIVEEHRYMMYAGIIFMVCCGITSITYFHGYLRWVGRVGLVVFTLSSILYIFWKTYIVKYKNSLKPIVIRLVMIYFSNYFIVDAIQYKHRESYVYGQKVEYKQDGHNIRETVYVDSLSNFVTKIGKGGTIFSNLSKGMEDSYIIYYKNYPDEIERIDTIR